MPESHYKILLEELREEVKNLRNKVKNKNMLNLFEAEIEIPEFQWIAASGLGKGGGVYGLGDSGLNGQFTVIDNPSAIKNALANVKAGIPATVNGQNNLLKKPTMKQHLRKKKKMNLMKNSQKKVLLD